MKKIIMYAITLFLVAIFTIAGTYAYLRGEVTSRQAVDYGTMQLQVIYKGAEPIEGELELVKSKEEGVKRELSIALADNLFQASANFYIHAEVIDAGFASPAFKWEFYEVIDGKEVYLNSGTLEGLTSNQKKYLKEDLILTTTQRNFVVYLWVNGHEAGNEVIDAKLIGYIGAETTPITGELS